MCISRKAGLSCLRCDVTQLVGDRIRCFLSERESIVKNTVKRTTAGAVLGGSLLFSGMGIANAAPPSICRMAWSMSAW